MFGVKGQQELIVLEEGVPMKHSQHLVREERLYDKMVAEEIKRAKEVDVTLRLIVQALGLLKAISLKKTSSHQNPIKSNRKFNHSQVKE